MNRKTNITPDHLRGLASLYEGQGNKPIQIKRLNGKWKDAVIDFNIHSPKYYLILLDQNRLRVKPEPIKTPLDWNALADFVVEKTKIRHKNDDKRVWEIIQLLPENDAVHLKSDAGGNIVSRFLLTEFIDISTGAYLAKVVEQ